MEKIIGLVQLLSLKDWLIIVSFCALLVCLLEIQRLKRLIAFNSLKSLAPQLMVELSVRKSDEEMGIYLKNEGFFIAQNIRVEAVKVTIDDYGLTNDFILEFEGISVLRPKERIKLRFKAFDKHHTFLADATEKILPHLVSPAFPITVFYENIEGVRFRATLAKKNNSFLCESVELLKNKRTA